jgi:hypothetical protein
MSPARSQRLDVGNLKNMRSFVVLDEGIISHDETVRAEMVNGSIVQSSGYVVSERPGSSRAASLGPAFVQGEFEPNSSKRLGKQSQTDFRGSRRAHHSHLLLLGSRFDGLVKPVEVLGF